MTSLIQTLIRTAERELVSMSRQDLEQYFIDRRVEEMKEELERVERRRESRSPRQGELQRRPEGFKGLAK